jgi:ketosteroid isomerase-like protein
MASANVDLVRSVFADWERGDLSSLEWADPEIEFVFVDGPEPSTYVGRAAMEELFRGWLNAFAGFRLSVDDLIELDNARLLALTYAGGHGRASGVDLALARAKSANLFELREGKVVRMVVYFDRDRALNDLGVADDTGASPGQPS